MTFYAIRHKASGALMPQGDRKRGYSHWNPGAADHVFKNATQVPRLLVSETSARRCIAQWAALPNARLHGHQTYDGEWDYGVEGKDDGRTKADLEPVRVEVTVR
jgi:hypothetical protein